MTDILDDALYLQKSNEKPDTERIAMLRAIEKNHQIKVNRGVNALIAGAVLSIALFGVGIDEGRISNFFTSLRDTFPFVLSIVVIFFTVASKKQPYKMLSFAFIAYFLETFVSYVVLHIEVIILLRFIIFVFAWRGIKAAPSLEKVRLELSELGETPTF